VRHMRNGPVESRQSPRLGSGTSNSRDVAVNHRPSLHDPEALLRSHEPEAVLRYYAETPQILVFDPDDDDNRPAAELELKATAHLCLGDLPAALESLNRAEAIRKIDDPPKKGYKHRLWSVVQFLMKNTAETIKHHKSVIIGIRDGSIEWTGRWGGALDALDLMYYSRDPEDFALARSFLWQLQKQNWKNRPGPVALHVMGELSQQDMLKQLLSVSGWEEAKVIASSLVSSVPAMPVIVSNITDPPSNSHDYRWHLENAAFYSALACRINGDEEGQRDLMMFCANIEPTYQTASFLSRHEVGLSFRWIAT
jgi:hypothetical protein